MGRRLDSMPLFWRVFAAYATVLLLAVAALVFAPITVSVPIALAELAGLVVMLLLTFVLIRPAFTPLMTVTDTMREIDPLSPGQRVPVIGGPQVAALADAFNDMLDRLEHERRESARQALTVQEAERQRIARELHDEVGQVFTAMLLQIQSLAAEAPDGMRDEL